MRSDNQTKLAASLAALAGDCYRVLPHLVLQGASVYQKPKALDHAVIIGTQAGYGADDAYCNFYDRHVRNKTVHIAGSSLYPVAMGKATTNYERSGYRADQCCFNTALASSSGTDDYIVQMVFKTGTDFVMPLQEQDLKILPDIIGKSGLNDVNFAACNDSVTDISGQDHAACSALGLYWDLSGYKRLVNTIGVRPAQQFMNYVCDDLLQDFVQNYACDLVRSEGDGFWLSMPVTGFSAQEKAHIMPLFLQAADALITRYDTIRKTSPHDIIRQSKAKLMLVAENDMNIRHQNSRFSSTRIDSNMFLRGRVLSDHAPRDRDVIVIDPALQDHLVAGYPQILKQPWVIIPRLS